MMKTTEPQIAAAIIELTDRCGYPPTLRELAAQVGLSGPSTIRARLRTMRKRGLVEFRDEMPRTLTVTERGREIADK